MTAPAFLRGIDMPGVAAPWHGLPGGHKLIVDFFAGGGGVAKGIEMALGRSPDIAVNHDAVAIAMHRANHPSTLHLQNDVWSVMPALVRLIGNRPVGLFHASPDCKHFSKAKGGKPVKRSIRDLAWVVVRFCQRFRPQVVTLENVEEFAGWGPLVQKIGADGQGIFDTRRHPVMVPCKRRRGQTFHQWIDALRRLGYAIEWQERRAYADGAPTIRKRLFVIARRDGLPIVWPAATHGDPKKEGVTSGRLKPWRTAAECIDWTRPCHSIFLTKDEGRAVGVKRPLADKTMARIAKGIKRFVLDNPKPFIVNLTHHGLGQMQAIDEPLRTVTGANRGEKAIVLPHVTRFNSGATGSEIDAPLPTVTANSFIKRAGGCAPLGLVTAHVLKQNHGDKPASAADAPLHTIVAGGRTQAVVETTLAGPFVAGVGGRMGQTESRSVDAPAQTVTAKADSVLVAPVVVRAQHGGGERSAEEPLHTVTASRKDQNHAAAAFLVPRYGERSGQGPRTHAIDEPIPTITPDANVGQLVVPHLMTMRNAQKPHNEADKPTHTITAGAARLHLVAGFLAKHFGGHETPGADPESPLSTVTAQDHHAVVSAGLINMKGSAEDQLQPRDASEPVPAICAQGQHVAQTTAFLAKYHGLGGQHQAVDEPLHTVDTRDRLALCTVMIAGEPWLIVDIGMRMLAPDELYAAQGFPPDYIIDHGIFIEHGKQVARKLTATAKVRLCGNSVSPMQERALIAANCPQLILERRAA